MIDLKKEKHSIAGAFFFSVILIFLFHGPAVNIGMGSYDLKFFVQAGDSGFSEISASFMNYLNNAEFRPINHYLFFLVNRKLFGYNPRAMHLVLLLLNAFNAFLVYLLILLITEKRRVAWFTVLVFLTRIAIIRSYYVLNFSPPKLCFFLLLTFISYIMSKDNKAVFLPLYCFFFLIAMFTRETFVLLPAGIGGYELIYNYKRKITRDNLRQILRSLYPFLWLIFGYILIRTPYFWGKVSLQGPKMEISYKVLTADHVFANLITLTRFNFNILTRYLRFIDFTNDWLYLIDIALYASLLGLGYLVYQLISKRRTNLPDHLKNNLIWGSFWFVLYIFLYGFFSRLSPEYIYVALIGSSLVVATLAEYFYGLFSLDKSLVLRGVSAILALHFIAGFYFLAHRRFKRDGLLKWWRVSAKYMAALEKNRPEIPPGNRLHIYSPGYISKHALGNKYKLSEAGGGYLFKYIYRNDNLEVIGHKSEINRELIKPGDVVFRLQRDKMIDETSKYR